MKKLTKLMLACGLVAGLAACNKEIDPQEDAIHKDAIWMSFKISVPETRAIGNPDTEVGIDAENKLSSVQLVLVDPTSKNVIALSQTGMVGSGDTYTCPFTSADLVNYADASHTKSVKVIAYCNCTYSGSKDATFNPNEIIALTDGKMATETLWNSGFIMSNAAPASFELPTKTGLLEFNSEKHPCSIGEIQVERAAARFDVATAADYITFPMGDVQITFENLGMFNISKEQYYLRRVSTNGQNTVNDITSSDLFGRETGHNYVVDTKATEKNAFAQAESPSNTAADFVFATTPVEWTAITDIKQADNWEDKNHTTPDKATDYCIWRYASENVLPVPASTNNQYEDLCTGVAFQGVIQQIEGTTPADLAKSFTNKDVMYLFNDVLYGNQDRLERAAHQGFKNGTDDTDGLFAENKTLQAVYDDVAAKVGPEKTFEQAAEESKFLTVYKYPYKVYYNYWNRHDNNNDPTASGAMEFAVVRNNVYKLRVNKIKKFGTPTFVVPAHKPIEEDNVYFEVTVSILPWTVKVNDIEF